MQFHGLVTDEDSMVYLAGEFLTRLQAVDTADAAAVERNLTGCYAAIRYERLHHTYPSA